MAISRRFKNETFNISEGIKGIKDTFATFVNAILVDFYNFLCVYQYFSRYSLRAKHTTFLSSTALPCSSKFFVLTT